MIYDYKGTEYEFPDGIDDNEAMKRILADQNEPVVTTPQDTRTDAQFIKDTVTPKNTWLGRLTGKSNESFDANDARIKAGDNPITSTVRAVTEGITNVPRTAPVLNKVYDKADEIVSSAIMGLTDAADQNDNKDAPFINRPIVSLLKGGAGALYNKAKGLPQPAKDAIVTGVNLLDFIPGTGAVAKIPGKVADATEATGEGILKLGKLVKKSETKIPSSVAKSAYGKTLLEKADGIIETMSEFGLTEGDNVASSIIGHSKVQERVDAVENIVRNIAQSADAPQVVPIHAALKGLKVKELSNTGGRPEARNALKKIIMDMVEDGHDQPVGIEQLIEAKKNLNRTGDLFSNGPSTPEALASRELRRKMYLNLTDAIGEISPEAKALNVEVKRLLDATAALDAAAYREGNKDIFGLTDHIIGGATLANPGALWAAVPMAMGKQAIKGGKLGNTLMRTGNKMLGNADRTVAQTLGDVAAKNPKPAWGSKGSGIDLKTAPIIDRKALPAPMLNNWQSTSPALAPKGVNMRDIGKNITPEGYSPDLPTLPPAITSDQFIAEQARKLRITPERIETLLSNQDALEAAIRSHEVTVEGIEAAVRETAEYMNQLKKAPVISRSRLEFRRDQMQR